MKQQTSLTSKVSQMFKLAFDTTVPVDKRTQVCCRGNLGICSKSKAFTLSSAHRYRFHLIPVCSVLQSYVYCFCLFSVVVFFGFFVCLECVCVCVCVCVVVGFVVCWIFVVVVWWGGGGGGGQQW